MNKLDGLDCAFRKRVEDATAEMNNDDMLHEMGVKEIIIVEGLRPLAVQMAYYSRGRMEVKDVKAIYRDWETDRKSTRLNSSHSAKSRMPSSA